MTVIVKATNRTFTASDVMLAKRELVDSLVREALIGQTEAFIEMIIDGQEDLTREAINETLKGVKDSARCYLNDLLVDLKYEVNSQLDAALYGSAVTGIKYNLAGEVTDIEADVSIGFE